VPQSLGDWPHNFNVKTPAVAQADLFPAPAATLPEGMVYQREFLTLEEEAALIEVVAQMPLEEMRYKRYTARRRVLRFGGQYDFDANRLQPAAALPPALEPLRRKIAAWLGAQPGALTHTLVAEYREGTPLGWHRDVPDFEEVVGVSLLNPALLRFRPYPPLEPKKAGVIKLVVEPRSIYLLRGPARWAWQHSVAPAKALRYSITFRTAALRASPLLTSA
jgi:alkylated DNA repair dioxygenase AlkB